MQLFQITVTVIGNVCILMVSEQIKFFLFTGCGLTRIKGDLPPWKNSTFLQFAKLLCLSNQQLKRCVIFVALSTPRSAIVEVIQLL